MTENPTGAPSQLDGTTLLKDNDGPIVFDLSEVDIDTEFVIGDKITGIKSVEEYGNLLDLLADQLAYIEDSNKQYDYSEFRGEFHIAGKRLQRQRTLGEQVKERLSIGNKALARTQFKDFELTFLPPLENGTKIRSHAISQGIRFVTAARVVSETGSEREIEVHNRLGVSITKVQSTRNYPSLIKSVISIDSSSDGPQRRVDRPHKISEKAIAASRKRAISAERRALMYPMQGGLPSLGKRS